MNRIQEPPQDPPQNSPKEMPDYDLREVHREKIVPLLARLGKVCEQHGIPLVASVCISKKAAQCGYCTLVIERDGTLPASYVEALAIIMPDPDRN